MFVWFYYRRPRMYKKISLVVFIVIIMFLFAGCDPSIGLAFNDIKGEWEFPAGDDDYGPHISIMESEGDKMLDISWYDGSDYYFCYGNGSYDDDGTFSLSYNYNIDYFDPEDLDSSGSGAVTVSFTYANNKLSAVCSGTGPLHGKTFSLGTLTP